MNRSERAAMNRRGRSGGSGRSGGAGRSGRSGGSGRSGAVSNVVRGRTPVGRAIRITVAVGFLTAVEYVLVRWMGERNVFTQLLSPAPGGSQSVNLVDAIAAVLARFVSVVIGPPLIAYKWVVAMLSGRQRTVSDSQTIKR